MALQLQQPPAPDTYNQFPNNPNLIQNHQGLPPGSNLYNNPQLSRQNSGGPKAKPTNMFIEADEEKEAQKEREMSEHFNFL